MSSVARRYARAILGTAEKEQDLEKILTELSTIASLTLAPGVSAALENPLLAESKRRQLASTIASEAGVQPTVANFVQLLGDNKRLDQIPAIATQFMELLDEKLGRVRATVTTATELDQASLDRIIATFEKKTGKKVVPEAVVDADLLGGIIVDVEGKVYDGSLRNQLKKLASDIAGSQSYI